MSEKEVFRLKVIGQLAEQVMTQRRAAERLGLSSQKVRRLLRRYERGRPAGLVSQRRGRASNRCIAQAVKDCVLGRIRMRYGDFGPTLAAYWAGEGF